MGKISKKMRILKLKDMRMVWLDKRINELGIKIHGKEKWERLKLSRLWHSCH